MLAPPPHHQLPHPHLQQYCNLPKRNNTSNSISSTSLPITSQDPILHFHRLLSDGTLAPNHLTFPSLFKACRQLSANPEGRQLHGQAIKRGFHCDVFVQRSLIRMYAKFLACRDARTVLARCSDPDVISLNDLIIGLCRVGDLDSARRVFDGMAERNVVTWSVMLDGYSRNGMVELAQEVFDSMPEKNEFSWNSLISGYFRRGLVEAARSVFDRKVPEWNVVTWTAMISGYVQNSFFKEALELFLDMQAFGVAPNMVTLISILPAVAQLGALSQGRWIHAYAHRIGLEVDSVLGSALVDMYSKCGCIEDAISIFERLKHKELSAWNSIILGLAAHGRGEDALRFFSRMQGDFSMIPNDITFIGVLSACSHCGLVDQGLESFILFTKYYMLTPNIRHYGCMVDLLSRAGLLEQALEFVEEMHIKPNSVIWKTLLSACRIHKDIKLADRILGKLTELGPQDSGFYSLVSNIFSEMGRWPDASKVRREMNDLRVQKAAGCSWVEVDGVVHEFLIGKASFHARSQDIICILNEMERLMKLENYGVRLI